MTSARAITSETLKSLYYLNIDSRYATMDVDDPPPQKKRKADEPTDWKAGNSFYLMLNFCYVVAFLCLLRFDEVLRIEWQWIEFEKLPSETYRLKLSLPFRKTHQTGGLLYAGNCHGVDILLSTLRYRTLLPISKL